jgi:hypothetical protein
MGASYLSFVFNSRYYYSGQNTICKELFPAAEEVFPDGRTLMGEEGEAVASLPLGEIPAHPVVFADVLAQNGLIPRGENGILVPYSVSEAL